MTVDYNVVETTIQIATYTDWYALLTMPVRFIKLTMNKNTKTQL